MVFTRVIAVIFVIMCAAQQAVAIGTSKADSCAAAIRFVQDMLKRISDSETFTYDDEVFYFGEQSILSHVLLLKFNYVDKAGKWQKNNKVSLLGRLLKRNKDVFGISGKAIYTCSETEDCNLFHVCVLDFNSDMKQCFSGDRICRSLMFCVASRGKDNSMTIDMSSSIIDGVGLPSVLGFSSEMRSIETYAGKKKDKWIPIYTGSMP